MTFPQSFTLDEEDRQAVLLALAILSIERPGWVHYLGTIAEKLEGKEMYEEFRLMHCLKESDTMTTDNPIRSDVLPLYQCHKKVRALKIKEVLFNMESNEIKLVPEDERFATFLIDRAFNTKHDPHSGGYYVVYEDGYKSFSPAEAFEAGYTLIEV